MASLFKIINVFLFFVLLASCSSIEFVYDKKYSVDKYIKNTKIVSLNEKNEYLISYLSKKLESNEQANEYTLNINSQLVETITSTNQDQSAASYYINNIIEYRMINNSKNCTVYLDTIETGFSYNAKSAGYSFGTDKSIEKNKKQNVEYNADVFLKQISSLSKDEECINENQT